MEPVVPSQRQPLPPGHSSWPGFPGGQMPPPESSERRHLIQATAVAALMVGLVYLTWRVAVTFAPEAWWLSGWLLALELHAFIGSALFVVALWHVDSVREPSAPGAGSALRVAVVIPTYQEPREVLLPTIAAAVALQPAHRTWVLDDGGREWLMTLCAQLGADYRTREGRQHDAKAGNINASLEEISASADLMAVLDADHVASASFLARVLGYFADDRLALVQTPQDFYNSDSFEHVQRTGGRTYTEQGLFYRVLEAGKNRWGAAFWCGTGAVIRLSALKQVGGLATETVTEDIHTTIRLHRSGWRTVYHNEVLARGLAAADSEQYLAQRVRWGTGAMQVIRCENPLTVSGLTLMQRVGYLTTLLGWFDAWRTLGYILIPVATVLSGAIPIQASLDVFLVLFGASFVSQRLAMSLLTRGRAPQWTATVFEFLRMPANIAATLTLVGRRDRPFLVTRKGRSGETRTRMPVPFLLSGLLATSAVAMAFYLATLAGLTPTTYTVPWVAHGAVAWLVLNAVLLALAVRRVRAERFGGERRASVRFDLDGDASIDAQKVRLVDASLTGALVVLPETAVLPEDSSCRFSLRLGTGSVTLLARVRSARQLAGEVHVGLEFLPDQAHQQADLALLLFSTGITPRLVEENAQDHITTAMPAGGVTSPTP